MVESLILRARRRLVIKQILDHTALSAAVALAGITLFLLAGTRYLGLWFLAPFVVVPIAFSVFRIARKVPDRYSAAILLDRSAELHDSLSTAVFFESSTTEYHEAQRRQAEEAARHANLEAAVPITPPKALYATGALALVAAIIFAIRFFSVHGLDLRPPLTEVLFPDLALGTHTPAKRLDSDLTQRKRLETAESLMAKLGMPLNPQDQKQPDALDQAINQALEAPGSAAAKGDKNAGDKTGAAPEQAAAGDPLDGKQQEPDSPNNQGASPDGKPGAKSGTGDSASLLSKLKDAVSNMIAKASPSDPAGKKGQSPQQSQGGKSEKAGEKSSGNKGQQPGQNEGESQDADPNGDAKQGQDAQAGAKSSQQSSQAGSGVGSQDGAKDLRAAEQLKAMGKISEIIGKRAATVTGETTVEVQSGNQQLRTEYSKKSASHGEADSDVNRDQIPVALQSYVRQYFEQVRKPSAPPKTKTATP